MKWELTRSQFEALQYIIAHLLHGEWSSSLEDRLFQVLLSRLWCKFYDKAVSYETRYKLKIEPELALVFLQVTKNHTFENGSCEGNAINMINLKIATHFAISFNQTKQIQK